MNIHKLNMDTSGNVEDVSFVLAKKNGDKICNINNIIDVTAKHSMKNASDFQFTTHKKLNNNIQKYWEEIKDFKLTWIPEWDMWYEIVVEVDEKDDNTKTVQGTTLGEAELSQIMLYGIEINTETDIARDDYEIPTTFYNPDHSEASLMNRLLDEKAPHYTIKHIDKSLMNLQRTFTFDDISLYDAFQEISEELDCLFVFGCGSDENGKPERTISVYDLEANCLDCGNRDTFVHKCPKCGSENIQLGYGQYTNVFISKDNLADEITYSVDTDSVKNCFKLEAGDDLMTAAIRSCNPNGTDYIYYFPDETRTEMSQELQDKLKTYDTLYEEYQSTHEFNLDASFVANYNALVKKYEQYDEDLKNTEIKNPIVGYPKLMRIYFDTIDMVQFLRNKLMPPIDKPDNDAQSQGEYLIANLPSSASTTSLKNLSVSTADNIMVMLAQSIVKGSFKTTVTETTLSNNVWRGKFNLQNYSDEDDKFTSQFVSIGINENYESYVKQRIDTILNRADNDFYDIVGLFKQDMDVFKSQLKKYCLNSLQIFQKCCQSAIDLMVQQGVSSNSDSSIYGINTKVLYENVYVPYYNKMNAIQDEIKVREDEVYTIEGKYNNQNELVQDGVQIEIERLVGEVQDALNFKNYIGINLYKEFSSFIRMDKYSNENYISDGLNNTELMQNAIEFISVATKELFKSATLQHSITGTIKNFLRMKEFEPVTNNFKNGNWICVGIDDKVYQLRIIEYEIDFSDTQNISVTFSDVFTLPDGTSYYERLEEVTNKMATSYSGVVRQSTINTNFKNKMNEMITKGLSMTNTKIVSNADNQDITWDEHGLLCREYDDILSDYTDSQLKIINHGIYITDDNWRTARAGIGNFIYYDPKDKTYKESYGVIADTLVSNLILTSEVGIYNEEKSIEMAKDGIIVTTNTMNKNVFTIRKEITDDEGNVTYERQLYIDDNGNIVLGGNASISWDNVTGTDNVVVKDDLSSVVTGLENAFSEKINYLEQQDDLKAETWYQANDPSTSWDTDKLKLIHKGDIWYNTNTQQTLIYNGSEWELTKTTPPDSVFDKIDGKAQIFISTPKPPYNTGDLWFNSTTSDIMTCVKSRTSGSYVASDWEKRNKYTDNSELTNFVDNVYTKDMDTLQEQVDGKIETFYYDYEPSLQNYPASEWKNDTDRQKHLGDFFYWKSKGYAYRFLQDNKTWKWQLVQDTDINKAMDAAGKAQDTADGKRRVFVSQPNPPYDIGDLWTQGTSGELMRCKTSRSTGSYNSADWEKATKYTDDSSLVSFINGDYATSLKDIKNQIDEKADTWYQSTDPSTSWTTTDDKKKHVGDLWYDTKNQKTYIYNTNGWEETKTTPPDEVFDKIDGKAQIFVAQPKPPYAVGDLWFNGTDILTCMTSRTSGSYTSSDWIKKNTYTDDSFAKQVQENLTNLKIGGRNLARNTSSDWGSWFTPVANKDNSTGTIAIVYPSTPKSKGDIFTISFDIDVKKFTQGSSGTFNIYLQGSVDDVWTIGNPFTNYNFKDKALKGDYTEHVSYTCQLSSDSQASATKFDFGFRCNYSDGTGKFRIRNLKVERGNKATDWTPAPEDTESYADNLASDLQEQIDNKIETFNQTSDPSTSWSTTVLKSQHKGDIWYNPNTKVTQRYNGSAWETLYNKEAQDASVLAQKKAQVFVNTPTIPYYKGDLWFGGTSGDIKTCTTTRTSGSYTASDWVKYNKYTDDSSLTSFIKDTYTVDIGDIQDQIDGKIETYRQDTDPSTSWSNTDKAKHKGDIWYDTKNQKSYIYNGSSWSELKTTPPDSVFSNINSKAQIFVKQPTVPYSVGDLWVNGTDILTCVTARSSGSYTASDWAKKNTYTDDTFAKQVQENLNNLQIGGRNLVLNSYKLNGKWSAAGGYVATTTLVKDSTALSKYHIESKCTTAGNGPHYPIFSKTSDKIGKTYTWSFEAKCSVAKTGNVGHECGGQTSISVTTEWKKFSHTWKFTDAQYQSFTFYLGFKVGEILYIRDFKIEEGSKATSWAPAPEDTESYADNLAADLQSQIDGKIETFSQTTDPSTSWNSTQKTSHIGDIWYNSSTKETKRYNGSSWDTLQNKEAQEASTLAQKKAQVFTGTPTIPYYKGDLWFGGTGSDIKTCTVTRTSGSYTASDWTKYNKYTDDTTANNVKTDLNNLSQVLGYNGTKITGTYIYSPHIIGGELSIGDASGVHASISTAGKLTATGAEITGTIYATNGVFSGSLNAATGTFTGTLSGANGTFTGKLSGATGSFTGSVVATSITAKQSYSIYYNDVGTGEPTDSVQVITAFDWGTNTTQIGFGLIDSSLDSSKMHGMLLIKEQGTRILTLIADDINTNGWLNVSKLNITDSLGQYKGVPYKSIMWNPTDTFDFNGYNHHHTILPYKNGNFAVGMESTTTEMLTISLLPYTLTTNTNADGYGNITVEKNKDTKSQISIGAAKYPFACIYVDAIYLTGDKKTYTSLANLGDGGTTNYNGLINKPKINNVTLASGNNTLADLGIASSGHTHSKLSNSNPVDYKGFGHCHTVIMNSNHNMWIAINNDNVPALTPYKLKDSTTYINVDTYTLDKGGTCNLGSTSAPWNAVYAKNYYDENGKAISMGSGITGGLTIKLNGTSKITSWKGTSDVIVDITASSIGALTSNDISSYATQNWVKGAFGDTLSISGNTLYLKNCNGGKLSYVTLPTSFSGTSDRIVDSSGYCIIADYYSGGGTHRIIPSTGSSYIADTILLGTDSYYFRNVYSKSFTNKSDYYAKEDFHTYSFNIEKAYMNIIPVSFKYKNFSTTDHHDRVHYGFIAQNIEKVFNENGISNTQLGMIKIEESKELNTYGRYKSYGLDYTEFISLNTHMTQKAHHRIDLVEEENQKLKNTILSLQGEISIIKQKLEELAC